MRKGLLFAVVTMFGCTPLGTAEEEAPVTPTAQPEAEAKPDPEPEPEPEAAPDPDPEPDPDPDEQAAGITVSMLSATLADDCGGVPNTRPAKRHSRQKKKLKAKGSRARKAKRRCEQSSIQLAIEAAADSKPADLEVKSVELLLESGTSVGTLQAQSPSVWSDADGYKPWDERVEPSQELSVSYALSQPDWSKVEDRWNQTFTVKAVLSVAGNDQTFEHRVKVAAPTSLPPGVKT